MGGDGVTSGRLCKDGNGQSTGAATQPSCKNALLKAKSISILAIIKWPSKKAPVEAPVDWPFPSLHNLPLVTPSQLLIRCLHENHPLFSQCTITLGLFTCPQIRLIWAKRRPRPHQDNPCPC